jgi:site-specific DNA recombinase
MTVTDPIKAVIYAAKSTEDRNDSIPEQLDDCRDMAKTNGWTIIAEFVDENFTAYSGNRGPGLAAAIQTAQHAASERQSVMLVAQHTSRFARGDGAAPGAPKALVELYHEWARSNVKGRLVENDLAMSTSSAAAAQGEADHLESKRKSVSVKKGMRRRARDRGKLSGGPRPYAYRWLEKELEIVPAEVEVVRRLFQNSIDGVSQRALARQLNSEGVPTVSGRPWGQATIARILANPIYRGRIRHAGEEYDGIHEAIITPEVWERAAAVRSSQTRRSGGRWPKGSHVFVNGLLKCGTCGSTLLPRTSPNRRGGLYQAYVCDGRLRNGLDFCSQTPIDRAPIDEAMLAEVHQHYLDLDATRRRLEARHATDMAIAAETLRQAEHEAQRADARLRLVQRDYQNGDLEVSDYRDQREQLTGELEGAHAAADRAQEHVVAAERAGGLQDAEEAVLRYLADLRRAIVEGIDQAPNLNAMRTLLRQLFEKVVYVPEGHPWLTQVSAMRESSAEVTGAVVVPFLRDSTVIAYDELDHAVIRRSVLPLETTDHDGFVT